MKLYVLSKVKKVDGDVKVYTPSVYTDLEKARSILRYEFECFRSSLQGGSIFFDENELTVVTLKESYFFKISETDLK